MNIGIDARMFGLKHAGIGRYVKNLINEISGVITKKSFTVTLFSDSEILSILKKKYDRKFRYCRANFPHYSLKEQLFFPTTLYKSNLDLIHFPHFNIPLFYRGPFVVTIHDLIKNYSRGPQTTTRHPLLYQLKYYGYRRVLKHAIEKSQLIFVPSQFVKNDILENYDISMDKIIVTYEGVDEKLKISKPKKSQILDKYKIKKPYLLYVGSVYPHKNLNRLVRAIKIARQHHPHLTLVIVSARNVFLQRLQKKINKEKAKDFIKLTGFISDADLVQLYRQAAAFVFPSLSEGFGLPPLEAMQNDCPVISSNASCLPEIYGQAALYFDPHQPQETAEQINRLLNNPALKKDLIKKGHKKARQYSWQKMAEKTIKGYENIISN